MQRFVFFGHQAATNESSSLGWLLLWLAVWLGLCVGVVWLFGRHFTAKAHSEKPLEKVVRPKPKITTRTTKSRVSRKKPGNA